MLWKGKHCNWPGQVVRNRLAEALDGPGGMALDFLGGRQDSGMLQGPQFLPLIMG